MIIYKRLWATYGINDNIDNVVINYERHLIKLTKDNIFESLKEVTTQNRQGVN